MELFIASFFVFAALRLVTGNVARNTKCINQSTHLFQNIPLFFINFNFQPSILIWYMDMV